MNAFISVLRLLKDIKVAMRPKACNSLLALLQMEEICWSKQSSESKKIPSKVSFVLVLIEVSPIRYISRGFVTQKQMTFSWIGFKIIILEPVKKFARDRFIFRNYCLGVPCTRISGSVISITSNVAFLIFIKQIN